MEKYVFKPFGSDADGPSDLALERRRADLACPGVELRRERCDGGVWERLRIRSEEGAASIGRPMGIYDTLTLPRMDELESDEIDDARNEVAKELCRICDANGILPERILVVGLGNRELTPDSVGPLAAEEVRATMHLKNEDRELFYALECSEIAVVKPGVTRESGADAADLVRGICAVIRPNVIFAIDALAARSPARLGTTVQICDTGIYPGSGLGNTRTGLTEKNLGAPVIAIGVPTVISSRMFVVEDGEARAASEKEGMFLSPKDINGIVKSAAQIIGGGINQAFGLGL